MTNTAEKVSSAIYKSYRTYLILLFGGAALLLLMTFSITKGAADIPFSTVVEAFKNLDIENSNHLLVRDMRVPRVISAVLVGCALAVSGAIMQGMTRNPLADSGLMGLSSGASLFLAISFVYLRGISYTQIILMSFLGAGLGASLVYVISGLVPGGNNTMKLILSGAAVSTLLSALSQGIAITGKVTQSLTFWTMGTVSGAAWKHIKVAGPVVIIALFIAIAISRNISVLNMGEEIAYGLGLKVKYIKFIGTVLVVLLAGTSVALAGSITFVGMLIPHFSRFIVGSDYRKIIPTSAVFGALLVVAADIGAKAIKPPFEIPIGAIISLLGVPVFLYFASKQKDGN